MIESPILLFNKMWENKGLMCYPCNSKIDEIIITERKEGHMVCEVICVDYESYIGICRSRKDLKKATVWKFATIMLGESHNG